MSDLLPHTSTVAALLRAGRVREAKALQNARVQQQFDKAKRGGLINLSDLMAGAEEIHLAEK